LSLFVDDVSCQVLTGLVGTFHVNLTLSLHGHADGVEADALLDGIGDGLVLHLGRHAEIFQFVVDEDDVVAFGLSLQFFQHVRHGHIGEGLADALCWESRGHSTE
jgi:hypothetical protein